jgi:hypothetical protein
MKHRHFFLDPRKAVLSTLLRIEGLRLDHARAHREGFAALKRVSLGRLAWAVVTNDRAERYLQDDRSRERRHNQLPLAVRIEHARKAKVWINSAINTLHP